MILPLTILIIAGLMWLLGHYVERLSFWDSVKFMGSIWIGLWLLAKAIAVLFAATLLFLFMYACEMVLEH